MQTGLQWDEELQKSKETYRVMNTSSVDEDCLASADVLLLLNLHCTTTDRVVVLFRGSSAAFDSRIARHVYWPPFDAFRGLKSNLATVLLVVVSTVMVISSPLSSSFPAGFSHVISGVTDNACSLVAVQIRV